MRPSVPFIIAILSLLSLVVRGSSANIRDLGAEPASYPQALPAVTWEETPDNMRVRIVLVEQNSRGLFFVRSTPDGSIQVLPADRAPRLVGAHSAAFDEATKTTPILELCPPPTSECLVTPEGAFLSYGVEILAVEGSNDLVAVELSAAKSDLVLGVVVVLPLHSQLALRKRWAMTTKPKDVSGSSLRIVSDPPPFSQIHRQQVSHGSLMWIGWMVFLPFGILMAAHFKSIGVWWFRLHLIFNISAMVIIYTSFIIIVITVHQFDIQFATNHEKVGMTVISLLTVTPILGVLANWMWNPKRTSVPFFPDRLHAIFGYITVLMGFANVFLGLIQIYASTVLFILVGIWCGLLFVVYFLFFIPALRPKGQAPPATDHQLTEQAPPSPATQ